MTNMFDYYYNNVPGKGLCRNNLIYTSLISKDKKTFCQWYYNDTEYHKGHNQIVDPDIMEEKWSREVKFLTYINEHCPDIIPEIKDIDYKDKKVYLAIDGDDFWERSKCNSYYYNNVLADWKEQMKYIIQKHKELQIFKYSMHPSSYFIVDGQLKSINYFFAYFSNEPYFSISDVESHIHSSRQAELKKYLNYLNISWGAPQPFEKLESLCWESFRTNYPTDFIEEVKCIK